MKAKVLHFILLFVLVATGLPGIAQSFTATYNFAGVVSGSNGKTDPTPVPTATGITFGSFTAGGSMGANPNAGGRFSFTSWPLGATNSSDVFTGSINTGQYYEVTISSQANFSLTLSSIVFTLQRSGTGIRQYAVRSSIDNFASNLPASISPANVNLQVLGNNSFQVVDASTSAENGSAITLSGITDITSPVTFRFYGWNAEASGGTFSIDNVVFTGSAGVAAGTPSLTINTTSLSFPAIAVGSSATLSYQLQGENLTAAVTLTATGPYTVSENNIDFFTTLAVPAADIASAKDIYIKFSPTAVGSFNGTVTNESTDAFTRTINLAGDGIDPTVLNFNFNSCTAAGLPGSGFKAYSVTGAQTWACSAFGNNSSNGVDINGYSGTALNNEDWLISPPVSLSSIVNMPVLSFYSRGEFSGPKLQLLVSTDYDGSSDPNTATWTTIDGNFPTPPGGAVSTFTLSDNISLAAYKSFLKVYIAFKYTSSPSAGAARWTLDDVAVNDQSTIFAASPAGLNFGEVAQGANSVAQQVNFQAVGYGDITLTAPAGYQLSLNNNSFSTSILIPEPAATTGTAVYVRFSPTTKALQIAGQIHFTATGLTRDAVDLTGSSFPKSETLDIACYNLSFFGSNSTNNPTQSKIDLQVANITTVIQRLNADIIGIEEVSNSTALQTLMSNLPAFDTAISQRWSYSFNGYDPTFPPQKVGFIYNKSTMHLVDQRVMLEGLYDSVRLGLSHALDDYPTGTPSSFWSSGRLPFMATFDAVINGVTKRIRVIDIHAKSAGDEDSYNRRVYDAKVLKDTLDAYYSTDNIVIVGDFNDRIVASIYTSTTISPYINFKNDNSDYDVLTYDLDAAGKTSFPGDVGMIDQIVISNEMENDYITGSTQIEPANTYINNYGANTASDHLPVVARFDLSIGDALPVTYSSFGAVKNGKTVVVSWATNTESDNAYFVVERSGDGRKFTAIATVTGAGTSNALNKYQIIDTSPLMGKNYYRIRQVDINGAQKTSAIAVVNFTVEDYIAVYPNPVTSVIRIEGLPDGESYTGKITAMDGRTLLIANGNAQKLNSAMNEHISGLQPGLYVIEIINNRTHFVKRFLKQ